jgi:transposase
MKKGYLTLEFKMKTSQPWKEEIKRKIAAIRENSTMCKCPKGVLNLCLNESGRQ